MAAHSTQPNQSHHVVTDEEYFDALPPNGLALAKEQLEANLRHHPDSCVKKTRQ